MSHQMRQLIFTILFSVSVPLFGCTTPGSQSVELQVVTPKTWNLHQKIATSCGHLIIGVGESTAGGFNGTQITSSSGEFFFVDRARRHFEVLEFIAQLAQTNRIPVCLQYDKTTENRVLAVAFPDLRNWEQEAGVDLDDEYRLQMIQAIEFTRDGRLILQTQANEVGELDTDQEEKVIALLRVAATSYLRFGRVKINNLPNTLIIQSFRLEKPSIGPLALDPVDGDKIPEIQQTYDIYRKVQFERNDAAWRAFSEQEKYQRMIVNNIRRRWQNRESDPVSYYLELNTAPFKDAVLNMPKPRKLEIGN